MAKGTFPGQYSDEPQFQIAGIADPSNYGGQSSEAARRTEESLARDADLLKEETPRQPGGNPSTEEDAAEVHRMRGDAAEKEGHSIEAVREYELAAQSEPSEVNLFAWGAELLLHRAYQPAIEVFAKGQRLSQFRSYSCGTEHCNLRSGETERGEQLLVRACDINPVDPTPYLFMGRLQEAERIPLPGWSKRLHHFSVLIPSPITITRWH